MIVANPTMIKAYKSGIPGNGKPFPDGSKIAKLQWKPKKSTTAPFVVDVPDVFTQAFVIEKDAKRFPKSGGWGYALFNYDAKTDTFSADAASKSDCGHACHLGGQQGLHLPPIPEAFSNCASPAEVPPGSATGLHRGRAMARANSLAHHCHRTPCTRSC